MVDDNVVQRTSTGWRYKGYDIVETAHELVIYRDGDDRPQTRMPLRGLENALTWVEARSRPMPLPPPPSPGDGDSEASFQAKIVALAMARGWMVYHTYDSRKSEPGFPDLILVKGNRLVVWELKSKTGRVTDEQASWVAAFNEVTKVRAEVRRPADWPGVVAVLDAD